MTGTNMSDYPYQIEYHKKDGTVLTIFVFSKEDRYVYSVYHGATQLKSGETLHGTMDAAFQDAFDYLKSQR